MQDAPPFTAVRICLSETALHTHTIMGSMMNANANDCQQRLKLLAAGYPPAYRFALVRSTRLRTGL